MLLIPLAVIVIAIAARSRRAESDPGLTPEQKSRAWIYVQGYKGHPQNMCQILVTETDNGALCNKYRDYALVNDKDRAQKWYICKPGWDCNSVPNENAR